MCQGFSYFSGFLHNFVLAKLATSSIRVNPINADIGQKQSDDFNEISQVKADLEK